jgi:uncharacterized protein involved in outer membrane biogenesis
MDKQASEAGSAVQKGVAILRKRSVRWTFGVLATLFVLFGVLGYFWLPGFAKAKLETVLSGLLDRPVRIERIEVSPYALSVTVRGFSIGEKGAANATGQDFVGFDSLYINVSSTSIFRRVPVISEVTLAGPHARIVRQADGRFNFSDIIDKFATPDDSKPKEPEGPPQQFSVANIRITGGQVAYVDELAGAAQNVTDITLGVPFIANTPGTVESYVQPNFSAMVNGAQLELGGKARPFAPGQDASMELSIVDFDLMRLTGYLPSSLPARLRSAKLDADLTVVFSRQKDKDSSVLVSGKAALRDVALAGALKGEAMLRLGKAELTLEEASLAGSVRVALTLSDFALSRAKGEPLVGFASLQTRGIQVSTSGRKATVDEVLLTGPFASVRRLPSGDMDAAVLVGDFTSPTAKPFAKPAAKASAKQPARTAAKPDSAKWAWSVAHVELRDGGVRYSDETLGKRARKLAVHGLSLKVDKLTSAPGAEMTRLDFATRVNEHGSISVRGGFSLEPVAADVDLALEQVDLVALQGWATQKLNAVLTRGEVSAKGHFKLGGKDASYKGDVAVIDLNVLDKLNSTDLVRWRSLRLKGMDAGSEPLRVGIREVDLANFFARLLLTPEGKLNVQNLVRRDDAEHPEQAAAEAKPDKAVEKPAVSEAKQGEAPASPAPKISVGLVRLSNGNIIFNDRFIKPNYTANLTDLAGTIGPVKPGSPTDVAIGGKVDRTGALDISGKMDPLAKPLSLDIQARAKGIEMANFSPYSGRYVGYAIEKGKLSVDLRYHVDKGALKAENQVFLDQLTFGKKVESKDAMNIPVNLVVALLSNSRGEIDINLPIEGSLNDPQFSIGGVIVKVIMNLLVKAATSPFRLLASLFGGGEDLSYVSFEPGRAAITAEADKSLQALAKAMRDRPGLKLEIAGHADPQLETEGYRRAELDRLVKAQKATELARKGKSAGSLDDVTVSAEEYPVYLARVYKAADMKKPRNIIGMAKTLPVEQMETLLLQHLDVKSENMERLAQDRGIAAQAWLVEKGGVEQARVFLLGPRVGSDSPKGVPAGGRVDFSLK